MLRKNFFCWSEFMAVAAVRQPLLDEYKVGGLGSDIVGAPEVTVVSDGGALSDGEPDVKETLPLDDMDAPVRTVHKERNSRCKFWTKKAVSLVVAGGMIALRATKISTLFNAIGSLGAGAAIQTAIQSGCKGLKSARVRQVCLTLLGQGALFAISQGYQNTESTDWKVYLTNFIIAQLGANLAIAAKWLYEKRGAIRVESRPPPTLKGQKLQYKQVLSHNKSHVLKVLAAGGFTVGYFYATDPLIKGLLSLGASFFPSQVVGERLIDKLDAPGWFRLKTVVITVAHALEPLAFIPWANPTSEERIKQLVFTGIGLGIINGVDDQSKIPRFERVAIDDMEEFQKLPPPERPESRRCDIPTWKYVAYCSFKLAAPIMALGVLGFAIWQEADDLKDKGNDARIGLAAMTGGFLVVYPIFRKLDKDWDPKTSSAFKNSMMVSLWGSNRVLGMPLTVLFFAGANSLKLDGDSISAPQSPYHVAVEVTALFAYGALFGRELAIMESDRRGSPQLKSPKIFYINSVTSTYLYIWPNKK
jgi:hypothetical protein